MKKILSLFIILSLLLSFAACKRDQDTDENGGNDETPATVNGVLLTEYKIVCDSEGLDYNIRAAEYIRDSIDERYGVRLEIVDDSTETGEYEIVVGESSREISEELDADTEGLEFALLAKDGSVAIEADYFVIAAAAYYLFDTYFNVSGELLIPDVLTVREPIAKEAKNFIMLIGDGMGVNQTLLYDYLEDNTDYSDGEDLFYGYMLPYLAFSRTQSLSGITDSAAGGTALATGYKTYNKYVGLDRNGNEIKSLTELAAELGKATAVMSTENRTGATPASFSSHAPGRDDTGVILESQGKLVEKYGTLIDCGYDYYSERYMKVIESHISDTLAKLDKDEDGFFIMYEDAHIDKHSHDNDMAKTFEAVIRFNQAIARFMEYAFYNPDTVVIITADHETGNLLSNGDGTISYNSTDHSAQDVPVFAWGHGCEALSGKTVENIEIAQLFARLMGADEFGDTSGDWYDEIYGEDGSDGIELPIIPVE